MKNYDDLVSRFNEMDDLPVSEEMLGAYIEGNLDSFEADAIGSLVRASSDLSYLMKESLGIVLPDTVSDDWYDFHDADDFSLGTGNEYDGYYYPDDSTINDHYLPELEECGYDEYHHDHDVDYDGIDDPAGHHGGDGGTCLI